MSCQALAVFVSSGGLTSDAAKDAAEDLRVIYYLLASDDQIWLFTLFGKDEAADLTPDQKRQLRAAIETELRAREAARRKKSRG